MLGNLAGDQLLQLLMLRQLNRLEAHGKIYCAVDIGKLAGVHAMLQQLRRQRENRFHLIGAADEGIDRLLLLCGVQPALQFDNDVGKRSAGGVIETDLLRHDVRSLQQLLCCGLADARGGTDEGLEEAGGRNGVRCLHDVGRGCCQQVQAGLWRRGDVGLAGLDGAVAALRCTDVLEAVDDNIVLREDDVAVFACKLKDELFRDDFAGRAQHIDFERDDTVESALRDARDAALLEMLTQQHAEGGRRFRILGQLLRDVERGAAAVHVGKQGVRVACAAYKQQQSVGVGHKNFIYFAVKQLAAERVSDELEG